MKMLIVDDKKENRYLLESLLTGFGHEVISAINGINALDKLHSDNFDMIISDILMPEMDGFQFLKKVKDNNEFKNIPFVIYTATYTEERDRKLGVNLGAYEYITKPIEPEEFIKIINGIIDDMESGKLKHKKTVVSEDNEVMKLYNERLVLKMEKKIIDLEEETLKRKMAEKKLKKHLDKLEDIVQERTKILEERNAELERYNKLFVNREFRIKELKDKIKKMEE